VDLHRVKNEPGAGLDEQLGLKVPVLRLYGVLSRFLEAQLPVRDRDCAIEEAKAGRRPDCNP
jgi:hypothetical protein